MKVAIKVEHLVDAKVEVISRCKVGCKRWVEVESGNKCDKWRVSLIIIRIHVLCSQACTDLVEVSATGTRESVPFRAYACG